MGRDVNAQKPVGRITMADVRGEPAEVKMHHRQMMRNNAKPSMYPKDGTPADALCPPGEAYHHNGRVKGIPRKRLHPHAGYEDHES